jgi:hypothetical protein
VLTPKFKAIQIPGFQEVPKLGFGIRLLISKISAPFRGGAVPSQAGHYQVPSPRLSDHGGRGTAFALGLLLALAPVSVFAQASAPPASAPAASAAASAPAVRGLPTPVGANLPPGQPEPLSLLAYLLIALAIVWFAAAIVGIVRLLMRPQQGPYAVAVPEPERDRPFLSFIMPFTALITVAIIVTVFGVSFLFLARISPKIFDTEVYPLAVDLFIVCFVMMVATILALRGGKDQHTEVH